MYTVNRKVYKLYSININGVLASVFMKLENNLCVLYKGKRTTRINYYSSYESDNI